MQVLDVINEALATLGETPVNAIDVDHPFIPSIRRTLDHQLVQLLDEAWWFNTEVAQLVPDSHGHVYVPMDAINVAPANPDDHPYAVRGRRFYDMARGQYEISRPVAVWLVRNVPFEELPMMARQVVSYRTVLKFQVDFDADRYKAAELRAAGERAYAYLKKEHIRNYQANRMRNLHILAKLGYVLRGGMGAPFPTVHGSWR